MGIYIKEVLEVLPVKNREGFVDCVLLNVIDNYGDKNFTYMYPSDIASNYVTARIQDPYDWRWYHSELPKKVIKQVRSLLN